MVRITGYEMNRLALTRAIQLQRMQNQSEPEEEAVVKISGDWCTSQIMLTPG